MNCPIALIAPRNGHPAIQENESEYGDEGASMHESTLALTDRAAVEAVPPASRGLLRMIRAAAYEAKENKAYTVWHGVRYAIAATYFWIGGNYLFGGDHVKVEPSYRLLENLEPGGIRTHGLILCLLAFGLVAAHRPRTIVLSLAVFYSALTSALIVGGWTIHKMDSSTPAWYAFVGLLSFILVISSPGPARWSPLEGGGTRA